MVRALMIGSLMVCRESLANVKSVVADRAIHPAGSGRRRSRSASRVARVRLPPAESPAMNVAWAGAVPDGPFAIIHS
jgi:hypothetical protein